MLDLAFSLMFVVVLFSGLFLLYLASFYVQSYFWGVEIWPGTYADYWGVRLFDAYYFIFYSGFYLLIAASVLFIARIALDTRRASYTESDSARWHLRFGLLLPAILTWGIPQGTFYGGVRPGFVITGVITPLYNYVFSGLYGLDASFVLTTGWSPFYLLGVLQFFIALTQYVALKRYEARRIGLRLFLIPILASLVQSALLFGIGLPEILCAVEDLALATLPVPIFTIGILIRAAARPTRMSQ